MRSTAAVALSGSVVDEFLERLRVEDGSSALTIQAYRRDLARLAAFLRTRRRTIETARPERPGRPPGGPPSRGAEPAHARPGAGRRARALPVRPRGRARPRPTRRPSSTRRASLAGSLARCRSRTPPGWWSRRGAPARATGEIARSSSSSTAPGSARRSSSGSGPADVDLQAQLLICRGKRDRQRMVPIGGRRPPGAQHVPGARAPPPGPRARPRPAVRERAGRPSRAAGALADRAGASARRGAARRVPPCAPPLVREPPPRGRGRPPVGPGASGPRRHRHHGDLHPPPDGRRSSAVPPVSPPSLSMTAGDGRGRRRAG